MLVLKFFNSLEGQLPSKVSVVLMFNLEIGVCFQLSKGCRGKRQVVQSTEIRCLKTGNACVCV